MIISLLLRSVFIILILLLLNERIIQEIFYKLGVCELFLLRTHCSVRLLFAHDCHHCRVENSLQQCKDYFAPHELFNESLIVDGEFVVLLHLSVNITLGHVQEA